jgi:hypothetical protein
MGQLKLFTNFGKQSLRQHRSSTLLQLISEESNAREPFRQK